MDSSEPASSSSIGGSTKEEILILEMVGYLIGFDLNQQVNDADEGVYLRFHVDLRNNGYPIGMRHVKTTAGKHYLVGGAIYDAAKPGVDPQFQPHWTGYSKRVFELNADLLLSKEDDVNPSDILTHVPDLDLAGAMCPIAFDLGVATYLLHRWVRFATPCLKPDIPFARFDSSTEQKSPPFYTAYLPDFDVFDIDGCDYDRFREREIRWPGGSPSSGVKPFPFPVKSSFVVGGKLLLFCEDYSLQWFTPGNGGGKWNISGERYGKVSSSFKARGADLPTTGLWLPGFSFDNDSLGVLLSIYKSYDEKYCDPFSDGSWEADIPDEQYLENGTYVSFFITYKVCAYAMSKESFEVKFYQQFDEVFSGILPPSKSEPLDSCTVSYHFLDLGGDGTTRRICVLLTGRGLTDNIRYLYVSIFDLRMICNQIKPTTHSSHPSVFLETVSPVKKLAFSLDKGCSSDDDDYEDWFVAFDNHILDAFVL